MFVLNLRHPRGVLDSTNALYMSTSKLITEGRMEMIGFIIVVGFTDEHVIHVIRSSDCQHLTQCIFCACSSRLNFEAVRFELNYYVQNEHC